jgi:hypothetical protein
MNSKGMTVGLLLVLSLGSRAVGQEKLQEFASREGRFRVQMAANPVSMNTKSKTPFGTVDMTVVVSNAKDFTAHYMVGYGDLPLAVAPGDQDLVLLGGQNALVAAVKGRLVNERKLRLGDFPGRECTIALPQGNHGRFRTYLVRDRLYVLSVVGTPAAVAGREAEQFLSSFEVTPAQPVGKNFAPAGKKTTGDARVPAGLERFTSAEGRFVIDLPNRPRKQTLVTSLPGGGGDVTVHLFESVQMETGLVCLVAYQEFPRELLKGVDVGRLLDQEAQELARDFSGKVIGEQGVPAANGGGKVYRLELNGGKGEGQLRMFFHGERLYQVLVIAPAKGNSHTTMNQVLTSFRILPPNVGKAAE